MIKGTDISAIVFFAFIGFRTCFPVACGQERPVDVENMYRYYCVTCHGIDGKGTRRGEVLGAPDFSDAQWQGKKTDEEILHSITHGKNRMPRWNDKLKPGEIQALARYVRLLARKEKS